uniref:Putative secreted protein n=1 Tax=Anopheles darlingi TaxID=43151 RepID=A0A2M4DKR2_ANODA
MCFFFFCNDLLTCFYLIMFADSYFERWRNACPSHLRGVSLEISVQKLLPASSKLFQARAPTQPPYHNTSFQPEIHNPPPPTRAHLLGSKREISREHQDRSNRVSRDL